MLHTEMDVWKAAMDFAAEIYRTTGQLPSDERYGLTAQIRRAAVAIPSNIAEGSGAKVSGISAASSSKLAAR
jgi:four helix bundle protein